MSKPKCYQLFDIVLFFFPTYDVLSKNFLLFVERNVFEFLATHGGTL